MNTYKVLLEIKKESGKVEIKTVSISAENTKKAERKAISSVGVDRKIVSIVAKEINLEN